jgi:pimeloyl-ACP methyl ester carboxylesterase
MAVTVKRSFIDGQFGQIHTRVARPPETGKAPIVCLHMCPKSGKIYSHILPFLACNRLAIAPDYPGHGESDPPPAEPQVTVEDFAESVWTVIDSLHTGPVHLVGYHTGSMVAVEAAHQRPADVLSIVNISAPVFTAQEQAALDVAYAPIPMDEEGSRFRIMWQRVIDHRGPGMTLQMAAASFAENLRGGEDYEWGHRAAFAYSPTYNRRLAEIEHAIFVLNPADDCYEQSRRADPLMKNGRRKDYEQWGHGFLTVQAQDAAAEILAFIEEIEGDA